MEEAEERRFLVMEPAPGESVSDTLAEVLKSEPEWERLPSDLPPSILRLLLRCLHKDRRERLQAIGDARLELQDAGNDRLAAGSAPVRNRRGPWSAAMFAVLALGFVGGKSFSSGECPRGEATSIPVVRSSIRLPEGVQLDGAGTPVLALSPAGSTLAFVGREDDGTHIYIRHMDSGETVNCPRATEPKGHFSPDGQWAGFGCGSISGVGAGPPRLRSRSTKRRPCSGRSCCPGANPSSTSTPRCVGVRWCDSTPGPARRWNSASTPAWPNPCRPGTCCLAVTPSANWFCSASI